MRIDWYRIVLIMLLLLGTIALLMLNLATAHP